MFHYEEFKFGKLVYSVTPSETFQPQITGLVVSPCWCETAGRLNSLVDLKFLCFSCRWFLWIRLSDRVQTGRWCPSSPEETASRSPSPTGRSTWSEPSSTGCTRSIDRYDRTSPDLRAAWWSLRIRESDFIVSSDGWIWSCSSIVSSRCCLDKVQKDFIWYKYIWG